MLLYFELQKTGWVVQCKTFCTSDRGILVGGSGLDPWSTSASVDDMRVLEIIDSFKKW